MNGYVSITYDETELANYVPTPEDYQVAEKLQENGGIIMATARAIGLTRDGLYKRIQNSPYLQWAVYQSREQYLDAAESVIFKKVQNDDLIAAMFVLKTIGKQRGYVEKQDVNVQGQLTVADLVARASSKAKSELPAAEDTVDGEIVE